MRLLFFFVIAMVLFNVSAYAVGEDVQVQLVQDNIGFLGEREISLNKDLSAFLSERGAKIILYSEDKNFNSLDDFKNKGRTLFMQNNLNNDASPIQRPHIRCRYKQ